MLGPIVSSNYSLWERLNNHIHHDTPRRAIPSGQGLLQQLQDSLQKKSLYLALYSEWSPEPRGT